MPVGDAAFREVVRRHFDRHDIAGKQFDAVHAHLAGKVAKDLMSVVEPDPEHRAGKKLLDGPTDLKESFCVLARCAWSWFDH